MDRTTDSGQPEEVLRFYDRLADDYDRMTGFADRFAKERPSFQRLVDHYGIRTAIDAGAGTGFHSLLLAQLGVHVTAADISPRMLTVLTQHAHELGLEVQTVATELSTLPRHVGQQFDAVITMGNTLAHCLSEEALGAAMSAFYAVLRPGGVLFAQVLNYHKILDSREELIGVRETGGVRITRRYEFLDELIRFIIIREDVNGSHPPESSAVLLRPVLDRDLKAAALGAGFTQIDLFGAISLERFDPVGSKDLVILAHKPG